MTRAPTGPPDVPEIRLPGGWDGLLDGPAREALEADVFPRYIPRQRWFGGKARQIRATRVTDWAPLPAGLPAFLALVRVEFADGGADLYFLPLGITPGDPAGRVLHEHPGHVLARLTGPAGHAVLHDAPTDEKVRQALLAAFAVGTTWPTRHGLLRAVTTASFGAVRGDPRAPLGARLGPATSSNSLVFYEQRLLLKVFRRLQPGVNPDFEVGRFLTETGRFDRTPKMAGALAYDRPGEDVITLGVLLELVPNDGDGWEHALRELDGFFRRAAARGPGAAPAPDPRSVVERAHADPPPAEAAVIGPYLPIAGLLGRRTAEMHLALASDRTDPAFAPEPLSAADLEALAGHVRDEAEAALALLRNGVDRLPPPARADADDVLKRAPAALAGPGAGPAAGVGEKIRCHGDYHLGQVLWAGGDFLILDFEGEPTRTLAQRRARQSPLKDVAGMLRSLDYAAHAGLFAFAAGRPAVQAQLEPWADLWQRWTAAAFFRQYRATAAAAPLLPADDRPLGALLRLFLLDKAFYELAYELNNRPDWVRIPLAGVRALLGR